MKFFIYDILGNRNGSFTVTKSEIDFASGATDVREYATYAAETPITAKAIVNPITLAPSLVYQFGTGNNKIVSTGLSSQFNPSGADWQTNIRFESPNGTAERDGGIFKHVDIVAEWQRNTTR